VQLVLDLQAKRDFANEHLKASMDALLQRTESHLPGVKDIIFDLDRHVYHMQRYSDDLINALKREILHRNALLSEQQQSFEEEQERTSHELRTREMELQSLRLKMETLKSEVRLDATVQDLKRKYKEVGSVFDVDAFMKSVMRKEPVAPQNVTVFR